MGRNLSSGKTIPWQALEARGKHAAWAAKTPAGTGPDVSVSLEVSVPFCLLSYHLALPAREGLYAALWDLGLEPYSRQHHLFHTLFRAWPRPSSYASSLVPFTLCLIHGHTGDLMTYSALYFLPISVMFFFPIAITKYPAKATEEWRGCLACCWMVQFIRGKKPKPEAGVWGSWSSSVYSREATGGNSWCSEGTLLSTPWEPHRGMTLLAIRVCFPASVHWV